MRDSEVEERIANSDLEDEELLKGLPVKEITMNRGLAEEWTFD